MAQKDQRLIFERAPYVDLVVGPGQLHQIPRLLEEIAAGSGPRLEVSLDRKAGSRDEIERSFESYDPDSRSADAADAVSGVRADQIGCDKFCTYCIVPTVRGPEQSRPAGQSGRSAQAGRRGLPRNHAAWARPSTAIGTRDGDRTTRLSDLLCRAARHRRPRPAQVRHELSQGHDRRSAAGRARLAQVLAVPARAGPKRLERRAEADEARATRSRNIAKCSRAFAATIPDAAVTSDFIVGFCGETEEDFQQTVDLVRESRFKNSFIFKYSDRPGTKGAELYADDVPEEVKRRRNNELLAIQNDDQRGRQSAVHRPRGRGAGRRPEQDAGAEAEAAEVIG